MRQRLESLRKILKNLEYLRISYHFAVLSIFLIQSKQSLDKYLAYPVIIQKSFTNINMIEKPDIQVCYHSFFDYEKAAEHGYSWRSKFLTGLLPNSTTPSWRGKNGNSTFQEIQHLIYEKDFSKVNVSKPNEPIYIFGKGFCLQVKEFGNYLIVTTKEKNLKVYLVHKSTDERLTSDKENPYSQVKFGATSNSTFDFKAMTLVYHVKDNTIFEGTTCVDYRKQEESFGDCNYNALAAHFHDIYGCYPPWMEIGSKNICEIDVPSNNVNAKTLDDTFKEMNSLHVGIQLDIMKQCLPPCYQVHVKWNEKEHVQNWIGKAWLNIYDDTNNVPISKAVYSFDIFTLIVELGSALGLWLGINMLNKTSK